MGVKKEKKDGFLKKITAFVMNDSLTEKNRIFNLVVMGAILIVLFSIIFTLLLSDGIQGALAMLGAEVFLVLVFIFANFKGKFDSAAMVLCTVLTSILLPVIYFFGGGIHSGMALWFLLGLVFEFMMLDGKRFYISFFLNILVILACLGVSYHYPQTVFKLDTEGAIYMDILQSLLLVSVALGLLVRFQMKIYMSKNEQLEERTRQLEIQAKKLEEAVEEAKEANLAKRSFLANMSHEIRTPLNVVVGMNEMIMRESTEDNVREYAQKIETSSQLLLSLIRDILDFSKIESGKMELLPVNYKPANLINSLVVGIEPRLREKDLLLEVNADRKIPRILNGDEVRIKQIILNLLTNAAKYTPQGKITLNISGRHIGTKEFLLRVSVKDTGIGIKEEDMQKLLVAFQRIEETRNRNIEGTGLGLNITNSLLEMMGSRLEVSSVYGRGSEFSFEVIQQVTDKMPMGDYLANREEAVTQNNRAFVAPEAEILIVDDNKMNLDVIRALLKKNEVKVTTADSGQKCIDLAKEHKYHIIFLDHMMPEMDGIETLKHLKNMGIDGFSDTVVIALTANAVVGAREEYIEVGFTDYLSKPVRGDMLESVVRKYLPQDIVISAEE